MLDFKRITQETFKYNFHSHTQFCDGRASMEDFVVAAINAGFKHYGFSPHSPFPFASPCNMSSNSVPEYLTEFSRLKHKYSNNISLYCSMEIDYVDKDWNAANEYFCHLPLDYKLGSVHFIPDKNGNYIDVDGKFENFKTKMENNFSNDIHYVVNTFYSKTREMIEVGGIDIVGHLDKIGQNASYYKPGIEDESWYENHVISLIKLIKDSGLTMEINTKALREHGRTFPNYRYFPLIKKLEIPIIFNSDTHYPDRINLGREEAFNYFNSVI